MFYDVITILHSFNVRFSGIHFDFENCKQA